MNKLNFSLLGETESLILINILDQQSNKLELATFIKNYKISNFFKGKFFIIRLIKKIFKYKLITKFSWEKNFWDKINITCVNASISTKKYDEFELFLKQKYSKKRIKNITKYKKIIENGADLGPPLYITGACLNFLGAKTENNKLFMLDGSRRLLSLALAKKKSTKILIINLKNNPIDLS